MRVAVVYMEIAHATKYELPNKISRLVHKNVGLRVIDSGDLERCGNFF